MGINKIQLGIAVEEVKAHVAESTEKIPELESRLDDISIAQKTVNTNLDFFFGNVVNGYTPVVNTPIPIKKNNGNMEATNGTTFTLRNNKTYEIVFIANYSNSSSTTYADIACAIKINGVEIAFVEPIQNNLKYETGHTMMAQWTNNTGNDATMQIVTTYISQNDSFKDTSYITIKEIGRNITIDPVEYVNTSSGIEDTPVGHILSMMGKTAPKHYLNCDGSIYNITDYPYLSQYIKDQFGSFNFFGGDGTITFAVPDLRGEFLRGTGTGTRNTGSGSNVGAHQDPTGIPYLKAYYESSTDHWIGSFEKTGSIVPTNTDKETKNSTNLEYVRGQIETSSAYVNQTTAYTSRPTNTAVLYCIKYEPTYFMNIQGLIEETPLWEGNVGNSSVTSEVINTITLNDSIENYDKIGFNMTNIRDGLTYYQYKEFPCNKIIALINSKQSNDRIVFGVDVDSLNNYNAISPAASANNKFSFRQVGSYVTKIMGIKYKTFQS